MKKKNIRIHCCCAPCSSYVIEFLASDFNITCLYYNPCITDKSEYYKRLGEFEKLPNEITVIDGGYSPDEFLNAVKGYENEPEQGERCKICFKMRLAKTFEFKEKLKFENFTTTLTVSPHKNAAVINSIGAELNGYLPSDFKKKDGYKRSIELSKQYGLYRQVYCGCEFSKR
ncbi:MAG: epoxyqueuosine reductase QueH [Ruminococcus sp.]|nr:epoxyqueuosine reductase QueH [Ruminococcus sp.]